MKQRRKTRFMSSKPSHGLGRANPRSSFMGHSGAKFFSGIRSGATECKNSLNATAGGNNTHLVCSRDCKDALN